MGNKAKARQRRQRAATARRRPARPFEPHAAMRGIADGIGAWAGLPMPVEDMPLTLETRYPYAAGLEAAMPGSVARPAAPGEGDGVIVNRWWSHARQAEITLYRQDGRLRHQVDYASRRAGDRITLWLNTIGASQGWDYRDELKALEKLRELTTDREFASYVTTGTFLHTSPRSGVTYLLRRCRPTVAMVPTDRRDPDAPMKILAVLCMHPVGHYGRSWGGAMVPTDDVIAHLLWVRSDEHGLWRRANQHPSAAPEAGI